MSDNRWLRLPEALSALEDLELPRLSWGVVDGFLSEQEVRDAIDEVLWDDVQKGLDAPTVDEYMDRLIQDGLLYDVPDAPQRQFRTRLAEELRLIRNLRQLWPPANEDSPGWWNAGATLVADYRLRVAARRYPRRDQPEEAVRARLSDLERWRAESAAVASAVIEGRSLARFQVDAAQSVLAAIEGDRTRGRIVTAGTGSGKTLAFYLPALLDIAANSRQRTKTPHTLALYPRNELLRDQAREALIQCRKANAVLPSGSRPIRIGLLYGGTPHDARSLSSRGMTYGWRQTSGRDGWVAPYFPCPTDECHGDLVWSDVDRRRGTESLRCSLCSSVIDGSELALTRESMRRNCPDILFSTTEMLSRNSTKALGGILGWRGNSSIRLVLLDEAHTYSGVHGAQVGLMLRRWRFANGQFGSPNPVFVGLSATLRDAGDYFASLIGVDRSDVEVIAPTDMELVPIGREYGLVLRGDPSSGASLLSTTIQTVMLTSRLLDRTPGIFGSSAFVFTDDLDVTNRLFDDLRDAEGYFNGRPNAKKRLAELRVSGASQAAARYRDGQVWGLAEQLGRLPAGLSVTRTSSQDRGVDSAADVVVATAALEVGFNDPRVGLVVQHKAPRDMASFVQRRGRAGRSLGMRPITVVVLSDYGRDRSMYQTYERLLDPEIDLRSLPIRNRFVEKIQGTHALLDWLHRRLRSDVRALLTPPLDPSKTRQLADALADELDRVLKDAAVQSHLQAFLAWSLRVTDDEAAALLWDEPRSLLLSVVPTALKRLKSGWRMAGGHPVPPGGTPLPEFMTGALFDPLNSPDIVFYLPPNVGTGDEESMPIVAGLRETAPGRVSRRFGFKHASHRTWVAPSTNPGGLQLSDFVAAGQNMGEWATEDGDRYLVVRPLTLKLVSPPPEVQDNSNAIQIWRTAIVPPESGLTVADFPDQTVWGELVASCEFALHATGNALTIRRLTIGSDGEVILKSGGRTPHATRYFHGDVPAALGFELEVDAFQISGSLLQVSELDLQAFARGPAWRTLSFRTRIAEDDRLSEITNVFARQWLADLFLVAYARNGLLHHDRSAALSATVRGAWRSHVDEYFRTMYRSSDPSQALKRADELKSLGLLAVVNEVLDEHAQLLLDPSIHDTTGDLLSRAVLDTLGSAVLAAIHRRVPDAQDSDLVVDVIVGGNEQVYRIVVSETEIGGLGLLEEFQRDYAADPRRFWEQVAVMCDSGEYDDLNASMESAVRHLVDPGSSLAGAVAQYRSAASSVALDSALSKVREALEENDGPPSHLLMSTLSARVLRPGASVATDEVTAFLAHTWSTTETDLGVEIDARVIAFHAATGALGRPIAPMNADSAYAALWLRGPAARNGVLNDWQPYVPDRLRERGVLEAVVADRSAVIDVASDRWQSEYIDAITRDRVVRLQSNVEDRQQLARALRVITALPIDTGMLRVYGTLRRVKRRGPYFHALIALAEGHQ
ncbi:protein DpdJ [Orlajensenia leifsoniae]|uniref:DEAD/DEAH box helicase n=1 Tax=Orlajensenia leifsoniae TaxID=2561933 RepID=A0A4Y9QTJ4_9MICO|nr:protein DpdJ [Leifsonia flava]TFV95400.1 DEAD/DEAH box helicase [Leifsonia flava]